jgi:deoxyribose-phosphate aldolase
LLPFLPINVTINSVPDFDASIAALIDHTLLKPEATAADIQKLCGEARHYQFACVCANPYWVSLAGRELAGSGVKVCTVVGFPLGASSTEVKSFEAGVALRDGAREIDMVLNIGCLRGGDYDAVRADIAAVAETVHAGGAIVKVILETSYLVAEEKVAACRLAQEAGADFVKTSTGFSHVGATAEDVALMRRAVGPAMGVKASGGIRTLYDLKKMVAAGATRVGASASVRIMAATVG